MSSDTMELFSLDDIVSSPKPNHPLEANNKNVVARAGVSVLDTMPLAARRTSAFIGYWLTMPEFPLPEFLPTGSRLVQGACFTEGAVTHIFGPFQIHGVNYWNIVLDNSNGDRSSHFRTFTGVRADGRGSFYTAAGDVLRRVDAKVVSAGDVSPSKLFDFPVSMKMRVASIHRGVHVYEVEGCNSPWLLLRGPDGASFIDDFTNYVPTEREMPDSDDDDEQVCEVIASHPVSLRLLGHVLEEIWSEVCPLIEKNSLSADELGVLSSALERLEIFNQTAITWPQGGRSPTTIEEAIRARAEFEVSVEGKRYRYVLDKSGFQIDVVPDSPGGYEPWIGFVHGDAVQPFTLIATRADLGTERVVALLKARAAQAASDAGRLTKESKKELARKKAAFLTMLRNTLGRLESHVVPEHRPLYEQVQAVAANEKSSMEELQEAYKSLSLVCETVCEQALCAFANARDTMVSGDEQARILDETLSLAEGVATSEHSYEKFAHLREQSLAAGFRVEVVDFSPNGYASRDDHGTHGVISETGFHSDCGGGENAALVVLSERHKNFLKDLSRKQSDRSSEYGRKWIPAAQYKSIENERRFVLCRNYWSNLESHLAHRAQAAAREKAVIEALDMLKDGDATKERAFTLLAAGLGERYLGHHVESSCFGLLLRLVAQKLWDIVAPAMIADIANPLLVLRDGQISLDGYEAVSITETKSWDEYKSALMRQLAVLARPKPKNIAKAMQKAVNPEKDLLDDCDQEEPDACDQESDGDFDTDGDPADEDPEDEGLEDE